ncbi:F-box protein CPR1-like [Gossypium arboreum]|uniref:F-box protein CPR1-like n=1 Tax=Gossypium arboreum TaxID=29729 RepID=UPI000819111C|nr:F-box protein CPR1-like [Gossypium arboreum]
MATLSHDLTIEILRGLSVKDLLRFKCVSKLWCFSIDDPYFIKLHLSHSVKTNTNYSLILRRWGYDFLSVNYDSLKTTQIITPPLTDSPIKISGSCNGLLALIDDKDRIFLWNPSTRKSQVLPSTEIDFSSTSISSTPSTYYGFGYEPISDDYKLVRMVQSHGNNNEYFHSEAKVYSLRSNCWRRIKDVCFYLKFNREFGFLANNALHWMVFKTPQSDN